MGTPSSIIGLDPALERQIEHLNAQEVWQLAELHQQWARQLREKAKAMAESSPPKRQETSTAALN